MQRHGFHMGIERIDNQFYLYLKATGKLTHEDYQKFTPLLDQALSGLDDPEILALVDITELTGWELRAAWDDFKLGLKHGSEFKKIALIGNQRWVDVGIRVGEWFSSGDIRHCDTTEEALEWLMQ